MALTLGQIATKVDSGLPYPHVFPSTRRRMTRPTLSGRANDLTGQLSYSPTPWAPLNGSLVNALMVIEQNFLDLVEQNHPHLPSHVLLRFL
ncbi:hypothetical protein CRG98_038449 [Punica granatum]|uniref:Uncharacterized protein n=1 Tax=Punica granatum TaxID=22663 RepID=A0A2I0IAY9_PUNGR|nr:hypothetical protein CRG98_038449 [Punica granatum]